MRQKEPACYGCQECVPYCQIKGKTWTTITCDQCGAEMNIEETYEYEGKDYCQECAIEALLKDGILTHPTDEDL